jgi:hypothetical protein
MATKVISTTQIEQIGAGIAAQISEQLKGLSLESHLKELNDGQAAITTEVSRLADKVAVQNGSVARTIKEVGDLGLRVSKLESDRATQLIVDEEVAKVEAKWRDRFRPWMTHGGMLLAGCVASIILQNGPAILKTVGEAWRVVFP